jgi:Protein of unknown function (DUF4079)
VWPYLHPALATFTLLLSWVVFRQGFRERTQRLRGQASPQGNRARHVRLGPWSVALMVGSCAAGLSSAVLVRQWRPLATFHGWLGLSSTVSFLVLWRLGRTLAHGDRSRANLHGVLGVLALFAAGVTGILGISLFP